MVGDPVWSSVGDPLEFSGGRWWWEILGPGGAESSNGHLRREGCRSSVGVLELTGVSLTQFLGSK